MQKYLLCCSFGSKWHRSCQQRQALFLLQLSFGQCCILRRHKPRRWYKEIYNAPYIHIIIMPPTGDELSNKQNWDACDVCTGCWTPERYGSVSKTKSNAAHWSLKTIQHYPPKLTSLYSYNTSLELESNSVTGDDIMKSPLINGYQLQQIFYLSGQSFQSTEIKAAGSFGTIKLDSGWFPLLSAQFEIRTGPMSSKRTSHIQVNQTVIGGMDLTCEIVLARLCLK